MLRDSTARILWVSDIHFFKGYQTMSDKDQLTTYIDRFIQSATESHSIDRPIDYILLTGDLAQMGTKADYLAFHEMLLGKLLDRFLLKWEESKIPIPLLISIPGNHDVKWDNSTFLRDYLGKIDPQAQRFKERAEYLEMKGAEFNNLFSDYSEYLGKLRTDPLYEKYRPFFSLYGDERLEVGSDYISHFLYGYIIDKRKNLIFVLLNSAWYSLGSNFNNLLATKQLFEDEMQVLPAAVSDWKNGNSLDYEALVAFFSGRSADAPKYGTKIQESPMPQPIIDLHKFIVNILNTKDVISEYNNQISGGLLLKLPTWRSKFDDYRDFTVVTSMHHPPNWLKWDEQYSYEAAGEDGPHSTVLREILDLSDLFLTGHEHVPLNAGKETIFEDTIHLKAGCFLNDQQHVAVDFRHSWYSILEIDTIRGLATQTKKTYNATTGWQVADESDNIMHLVKKHDKYALTPHREAEVRQILKSINLDMAKQYINSRKLLMPIATEEIKMIRNYSEVDIYGYEGTDRVRYFLFAKSPDFYRSINNTAFYQLIDDLFIDNRSSDNSLVFLVPDLLVDDQLTSQYREGTKRRDLIRDQIFKQSDIDFDHFRSDFFLRFEPAKGVPPTGDYTLFKLHQYLKMVNHVMPYYELTPYMN